MGRLSSDELAADGTILNGFDYHLQVWVIGGVCQPVGLGAKHAGKVIKDVPGHEVRPAPCHSIHCRHYNLPYGRPCDVQAEQERSRTWNP